MAFDAQQQTALLQLPYVGDTVLRRIKEVGFDDVALLKTCSVETLSARIAEHMHSTCWKNSPQAKQAIAAVLAWAQQQ